MELYNAAENIIRTEIDNYVDFRLFLETISVTHVREALLANLAYLFIYDIDINSRQMFKVRDFGHIQDSLTHVKDILAKRMKIEYYETDNCGKFYNMILLNENLKKVRLTEHVFNNGMTIEREDVKCYFTIRNPMMMEDLCHYYPVKRNNIFVKIITNDSELSKFDQGNINIYSIDLTIRESDVTIPKKFNNLRIIHIDCQIEKDTIINIDGFEKLENVFIDNGTKHTLTLNISNVPYLICAEVFGNHQKNIDSKTVNVYKA
jgi:hypothetical protein